MSQLRENVRIRDNVNSEEELLSLQEEFLANKPKAAATVIRESKPPTIISSTNNVDVGETNRSKKKKSKISVKRQKSLESNGGGSQRFEIDLNQKMDNNNTEEIIEQEEQHVPVIKKVLDMHSYQTGVVGTVTENVINNESILPPNISNDNNTSLNEGFPKPIHRSLFKRRKQALDEKSKEKSKSSLENLQNNQNNDEKSVENFTSNISSSSSSSLNTLNKDTKIFNSDYLEIDRENVEKISNMSEEEILQTVEMLRQTLSPTLIEKLSKSKSLVEKISEGLNEESEDLKEKEIKYVHFEETILKDNNNKEKLSVEFGGDNENDDDSLPLQMKEKYFPNVPIEPEKIEWMGVEFKKDESRTNKDQDTVKDSINPYVPKPSDPPAAFYRFDFHGNIIKKDADIPTYMGLHHHGDNPDQAGYTLSELLHLSRSRVSSQRIIPLNVIGRIMRKVRKGHYGIEKCKGISEWMIKMKLSIYLRTALDDTSESVIVAAVDSISALIIGGSESIDGEEEIWDRSGRLYRGYEGVTLKDDSRTKVKKHFGMDIALQNENEEDVGTTEYHVKLASRDLIAGLISMDILYRFRYLLEKLRLPYNTNEQIILILVRFARHSHKSAKSIFECPQLIDIIHKNFLCITWPVIYNDDGDAISQFPSLPAVKLFRLLCQSSEKISQNIIQNYIETFLRYIVVNPSKISNEFEMNLGYKILQEILRIYQTLAAYGLYHGILSQAYSIFGGYLSKEIIYSLIPSWQWKDDVNILQMKNKLDISISFFRLLEIWIRISKDKKDNNNNNSNIDNEFGAQPSEFINDSIEFLNKFINSFPSSFEIINKIENSIEFEKTLILISSVTKYISSWYQYLNGYPLKDTSQIKNVWEKLNLGSWKSLNICKYLSNRLPIYLNDYYNDDDDDNNNTWQLSNLSGAYYPNTFEKISKSITISVIYDFYFSYISLIKQISNLFSNDKEFSINSLDVITKFFPTDLIQSYIIKDPLKRNWFDFFSRTRTYLLYEWMCTIITLIDNIGGGTNDKIESQYSKKLLQVALILMSCILPGDEKIILDILNKILDKIIILSSDSKRAEQIKKSLRSFYKNRVTISNTEEEEEIYSFSGQKEEEITLLWNFTKSNNNHDGLPLSRAWIWIPIDILYSKRSSNIVMDEEIKFEVVRDCLIFSWEIMEICQDEKEDSIDYYIMNPAIVVLSIMKIFLLEGELYRNSDIEIWIDKILSRYTFGFRSRKERKDHETIEKNIEENIKENVKTIVDTSKDYSNYSDYSDYSLEDISKEVLKTPFYTFFTDFSAAYASESFGHKSFAQCIIITLSKIYPFDFKFYIWGDLFEILNTININFEQVLCLNYSFNEGLKNYFWPLENNKALIQSFVNSIIYNKLERERNSFLYWIVIHHLNGFVFWNNQEKDQDQEKEKEAEGKKYHQMRVDVSKAIVKGAKFDVIKDWINYTEKNFGDNVKDLTKTPKCFEELDDYKLENRLKWLNGVNIDINLNKE